MKIIFKVGRAPQEMFVLIPEGPQDRTITIGREQSSDNWTITMKDHDTGSSASLIGLSFDEANEVLEDIQGQSWEAIWRRVTLHQQAGIISW